MKNAKRIIWLMVAAITAGAMTCMASPDSFEPDNDYSNAGSITTDGQAQSHSINPAADEDWLIFTVEARSDVVIETSGISGDTVMWLYNAQVGELSYDDDGGAGNFSRIQMILPTGTYYVRIKEYSDKTLIAEYFVSVLAIPRNILSVKPNSATQGDSLEVTIEGQGTTFFQGSSTITNVWLSRGSATIDANSFTGIDATTLEAFFDIPLNALAGKWNLHVSNSVDGELPSLADGFLICTYPDLNGDGKVDAIDFALLAKHWLEVAVPNVTGMTQEEAEDAIEAAFLVVGTITQDYHAVIPSGNAISSVPVAGTKVNAGSTVNLLISMGLAAVPNVTGMTQAEAEDAIEAASLVVGIITQDYDPNIPSGNVISSEPVAGTEVNAGSTVNLLVSIGPVHIVPNLTGMTHEEAEAAIEAAGLLVGTLTEEYSDTVVDGNIISQDPPAGEEVLQGSTVNLIVSKGSVTGIVLISINDPGVDDTGDGIPDHENFNGQMSKYETTNAQYCQFLNAALASGDITVSGDNVYGANGTNTGEDFIDQVYYSLAGTGLTDYGATNGGAARINYTDGSFNVESDFENHPVTYVSWYGATAFCNYYDYRLPSEWEWQAVADFNDSYIYGCGTIITTTMANYRNSAHPNGTTAVGDFGTYGYGMADMAGNVWEWTSSCYYSDCNGSYRVLRGGCWSYRDYNCTVANRSSYYSQSYSYLHIGFRVCR